MFTVQQILSDQATKFAEMQTFVATEQAQAVAALEAAVSETRAAMQGQIDALMAQIAAGEVVTDEQRAALLTPFDALGAAIANIWNPPAPVEPPVVAPE